ncbi:MAG TPA: hypothetical protein VGC21_22845 [Telluria sp.]|jgi:hypothetical protein
MQAPDADPALAHSGCIFEESPILQAATGVLFLVFLAGAVAQVKRMRNRQGWTR